MTPFIRDTAPTVLMEVAEEATASFVRRRREDPSATFTWPQRSGQSVLGPIREALLKMTSGHCSYCDSCPIDATGRHEVDHFRPKADFPAEVCDWLNLFVVCSACNEVKLAEWNAELLRPDAGDYSFARYFHLNPLTGELRPNPGAPPQEQTRATETIRIFGLQRPGLCTLRKKQILSLERGPDRPYRFIS